MKQLPWLLLVICAGAAADCPDREHRVVVGKQPLTSKLYAAARKAKDAAWADGFEEERFYYLGTATVAGERLYVTYLDTVWGPSCRATHRLVFFDRNMEQDGQYYGIQRPTLQDSVLTFSETAKTSLTEGLPESLYDGDSYAELSRP